MSASSPSFGELVDYEIGGGWGTETEKLGSSDLAYVIRGTDIPRAMRGDVSTVPSRFHTESNLRSRELRAGDIVFEVSGGSKGQPVGRALLVTERLLSQFDAPVMCASFCKLIRIDRDAADPGFVFRTLQAAYSDGQLDTFQVQSTGITNFKWKPFLEHFRVNLPDRVVQTGVAAILAVFDDLIENNRRRVEVLEEMARATYREWFVRLRYPGHENAPFVDSADGQVPEGWEVKRIAELSAAVTRGIAPKYATDGAWVVLNQRCVRDERVSLGPARRQERQVPEAKQARRGDVLVNSTGVGTLGRVALYRGESDHVTVDSHVTIARPANASLNPWYGLTLVSRKSEFERLGTGSTGQTELSRRDVGSVTVVLPPLDILMRFAQTAWPLLDEADSLLTWNESVVQVRDLLLPKLVAGQIKVSSLELVEGSVA